MKLTQETIRDLFGFEAAEDDNLDNLYGFYVKGQSYKLLNNDHPLYIVVGHKGTGKSALLKIFEKEERQRGNLPILLNKYYIFNETETDLNKMINLWQEGLSKIIFNKLLESVFTINKKQIQKVLKNGLVSS